ncbi:MAG: VWA-like domain-containing protein [Clostridia bacterium]|nr:VWA-like domain-containing protein [Clostridia bacterium]
MCDTEIRAAIAEKHPFLGPAMLRLPIEKGENNMTDGRVARLKDGGNAAYIHMLCHCLLGHVWMRDVDHDAADIQAALLGVSLAPEQFAFSKDNRFLAVRERLSDAYDLHEIARRMSVDDYLFGMRETCKMLFALDDHRLWRQAAETERLNVLTGSGVAAGWKRQLQGMEGIGTAPGGKVFHYGHLPDTPRRDYAAILRRYAEVREEAGEDPDSFQPGLYHYGLSLYGNTPIVEPFETREARRLNSIAIVIDTSGSCSRSLTAHFLAETRAVVMEKGLFFRRFRLRIIQCDAKVRRDDLIDSEAAFRRYIDGLAVLGGGGTDFRPAFDHITRLTESGDLPHLRGAVFFTDGKGIYPNRPPRYDTTFVFMGREADTIDTPPWIRRVLWQEANA